MENVIYKYTVTNIKLIVKLFNAIMVIIYRNTDKIADLERKINGYKLSRDDELKNVVTLETRLDDCRENVQKLREKLKIQGDTINFVKYFESEQFCRQFIKE